MSQRLQDKVCIITGAASGIGRGTAVRFAEEGAQLVLADVNEEGLHETARQVGELSQPALVLRCNVAVKAEVDAVVEEAVERFGRLDVMFANAGVGGGSRPFLELTEADWDRVLGVNLKGVAFCGQAAAKAMVKLGTPGRIINTASTYSEVCAPNTAAYSASKGGVRMLTKVMAVELGKHGITVNAVGPGWIRTGMNPLTDPERLGRIMPGIPLGRVGTPTDVAGAVLFLASDDGAYVTGATIFVDGGWILQ
jgi:glucose 1-dehydrogenase